MIYGDINKISKEVKNHIVSLLQSKLNISEDLCKLILEEFFCLKQHVDFNQFKELLSKKNIILNKEQVFCILNLLVEIGIAVEHRFEGDEAFRYEPFNLNDHHDHFICMKCQKVVEFSSGKLEELQDKLLSQKGCQPLFHKLEVYGLCDECNDAKDLIIPLAFASEGSEVLFERLEGKVGFRKRLADLGFNPGEKLRVIKNSNFGPVAIEIKNTRLAIGRGEANKIIVKKQRNSDLSPKRYQVPFGGQVKK